MTELLDCTLRDGGYYTNWEFSDIFLEKYFKIVNRLGIKHVELGYCNPESDTFKGEFYYCHPVTVQFARSKLSPDVNLWLMVDLKYFSDVAETKSRLMKYSGAIFGVRITVPPEADIVTLTELVRAIKECNLEVSLNLMYSHTYVEDFSKILRIEPLISDVFVVSLVDSYGILRPFEVGNLVAELKSRFPKLTLGFHGHNNLELAVANALSVAGEVDFVDVTIGGLGRGAGNVRTELAYLIFSEGREQLDKLAAEALCWIDEVLTGLKAKFKWGAEIPYSIAAYNKMPQANVMHLMSLNRLSYIEIVNFSSSAKPEGIIKENTGSFEIINAKAGLCISHSSVNEISFRKFALIYESLNLQFVSFLGINSVKQHLSLIAWILEHFDLSVIICVEGTSENLEFVQNISIKKMQIFLTPPVLSNSLAVNVVLPQKTLNNPLEFVDSLRSDTELDLLVLQNFDGDNPALRFETAKLIKCFNEQGIRTISLTETKYEVPEHQIFTTL